MRPAAVPVATAPLESASNPLILPPPVPAGATRWVALAGGVQVNAVEDFSLQKFTSQEFPCATLTVGVVKLVALVLIGTLADAVTDAVPRELRYAETARTDLLAALVVTVTVAPSSVEVATLVQARPRIPVPLGLWMSVQPGMVSLMVSTTEFVAMNRTSASPGCTVLGTTTEWLVLVPVELAEATYAKVPGAAEAGDAVRTAIPVTGIKPATTATSAALIRLLMRILGSPTMFFPTDLCQNFPA